MALTDNQTPGLGGGLSGEEGIGRGWGGVKSDGKSEREEGRGGLKENTEMK